MHLCRNTTCVLIPTSFVLFPAHTLPSADHFDAHCLSLVREARKRLCTIHGFHQFTLFLRSDKKENFGESNFLPLREQYMPTSDRAICPELPLSLQITLSLTSHHFARDHVIQGECREAISSFPCYPLQMTNRRAVCVSSICVLSHHL